MATVTQYELDQKFNSILRFSHSRRFVEAARVLRQCAAKLRRPIQLIDIGCAHGTLYDVLAPIMPINYSGIEINSKYAERARERHVGRENFRVFEGPAQVMLDMVSSVDVVAALETLEHIPLDVVTAILDKVVTLKPRLFLVSVPVEIGPAVFLKNVSSALMGYKRHHGYTWRDTLWASLYRLDKVPPHAMEHRGFDWRWLSQEMNKRFSTRVTTLPIPGLPAAISTSIFFTATSAP